MLSGDKLGIIDPHQHIFSASSHGWNISKRRDLLATVPHQLEPFLGIFGCSSDTFRSGFYKGTLFRFPLRSKPSLLSNVIYAPEKIQNLLENFENDAHLLLLFLKNVERIAIYERDKQSRVDRLLYRAEVSDDCIDDVRRRRTEFMNQIRSGEWQDKPVVSTYQITIITESLTDKVTTQRTHRFLITNYYCGGFVSPVFKNLYRDPDLGYLPWVGTAMRVDIDASEGFDVHHEADGRLFSFLPLPCEQNAATGLPVHVHGFFALEQNRKYIKWPTAVRYADMHMDKGLLWNQCILREALPKAYVHMILEAVRANISGPAPRISVASVYHALPNLAQVERKWEPILAIIYAELLKCPIVYRAIVGGGSGDWIEPKLAVFNTLDPTDEATSVILEILETSSVCIVDVPEFLVVAVRKYGQFNLGQVTAAIVASACRDVQYNCSLHWESKMKLLRYFLRQSKFELLDGLELLPLANGGFDVFHFNPKKADRPIYIAASEELQNILPGLKDDFLESDIDDDIKKMLTKAALRGEPAIMDICYCFQ